MGEFMVLHVHRLAVLVTLYLEIQKINAMHGLELELCLRLKPLLVNNFLPGLIGSPCQTRIFTQFFFFSRAYLCSQ